MRKIVVLAILAVALSFWFPTKAYAISATDVQNMIDTSIAPLQSAITSLQNALSALQNTMAGIQTSLSVIQSNIASFSARLTVNETLIATDEAKLIIHDTALSNHETRITSLENNAVNDFNLPASWVATVSANTITVKSTKGVVSLSCNWNGLVLGQQVQVRGIAHLTTKDYYAVSNCDAGVSFTSITNFPPSGSTIPVDLWAFWQGKTKSTTVLVPMP